MKLTELKEDKQTQQHFSQKQAQNFTVDIIIIILGTCCSAPMQFVYSSLCDTSTGNHVIILEKQDSIFWKNTSMLFVLWNE